MIHSVSVVFVILSIQQSIMNAKEFDEKFSTSKGLQLFSGVGLAIFTSFMAVSWQKALSQVKTADASPAAVSEPAPENTPTASSSVSTQPIASSTATTETPMVTEEASITDESSTEAIAPSTATTETPMVTEEASMTGQSTPEPTIVATSEITDTTTLQDLKGKLYDQIDQNWTQLPTFSNHLVYRVAVKSDGAISAYEAINPAAKDYVNQIPLSQLSNSTLSESADMGQESVAKFLVMFTPGGLLEVSPWVSKES